MLYWIYTVIIIFIFGILAKDFFKEKKWQNQVSIAMVLVVLILRILQIK